MGFGFLWLALGAVLAVIPYKLAGAEAGQPGALFLPYGLFCLVLGLLFTMAFVRNETDAKLRDIAVYVVGGRRRGPRADRLPRRHTSTRAS